MSPDREEGPELFFGVVGAVGSDLHLLDSILREVLSNHLYRTEVVHLSSLLKQIPAFKGLPEQFVDERTNEFMTAGTELRKKTGRRDAMAVLGIQQVRKFRQDNGGEADKPLTRHAFLFHSLKRPEEVDTLRRIYGPAFFLIGAYAPREKRKKRLVSTIANSRNVYPPNASHIEQADQLILRDEHEDDDAGQHVAGTFPKADVFVDVSANESAIRSDITRFLEIVFGHQFHTPTRDENGMFHAFASGLRSAEMGRQVGAALTTPEGDITSLGTNDVPVAGGGLYWPEGEGREDHRDFQIGHDTSDVVKKNNLAEVLDRLRDAKLLDSDAASLDPRELLARIQPLMAQTRVMNSIEFGRAVHAEMDAITGAARRGIPVKDCTLYATTFPCHNCTRHIVSAGIKRVVFIEPYAKSLASDLHDDSIIVEGDEGTGNRVTFVPFVGIAPHRYIHLFQMEKRKKDGKKIGWSAATSLPRVFPPTLGYIGHEVATSGAFLDALEGADISRVPAKGDSNG